MIKSILHRLATIASTDLQSHRGRRFLGRIVCHYLLVINSSVWIFWGWGAEVGWTLYYFLSPL